MKSFFSERKKNFTCPSNSESSVVNIIEDVESEIEETQKFKKTKLRYISNKSSKVIEIASIKNLPTIIFILSLIMLSAITIKLVPTVYNNSQQSSLFVQRKTINYLSYYISEQPLAVKSINIASQVILLFVTISLTNLLRQRISVPEFSSESWKNNLILLSGIISVLSMIFLTIFNKETLYFSQRFLGLIDNILFLIYLSSCFIFCMNSYLVLSRLNIREIPKESICLNFKRYLIMLMAIQLLCYIWSLVIISYYRPIIEIEKVLLSFLIITFFLNSFFFLLCAGCFMFSLKYDLYYVSMNLQIRPDIEYFVDLYDCNLEEDEALK